MNRLLTVVAPDDDKAVWINQDAWFTLGKFSKDFTTTYGLHQKENGVYVFVLNGNITVNDQELETRDGLGVSETDLLTIKTSTDAEILLVEVPMQIEGA
jgi:redox-sensitive bicupin YhaK (pirin superfamily)